MPDSFSDPTVPRWDAPPPQNTGHVLKHQPHKCPYPPAVDGLVWVCDSCHTWSKCTISRGHLGVRWWKIGPFRKAYLQWKGYR